MGFLFNFMQAKGQTRASFIYFLISGWSNPTLTGLYSPRPEVRNQLHIRFDSALTRYAFVYFVYGIRQL